MSVSPAARRSGITTAAAPAAWAVRMIAPRLCGSSMPSSTTCRPPAGGGFFERRYVLGGAEGDHALVLRRRRGAIQLLARLEAHRDAALAAQIDDFLKARPGRALGDQDPVQRPAGLAALPGRDGFLRAGTLE